MCPQHVKLLLKYLLQLLLCLVSRHRLKARASCRLSVCADHCLPAEVQIPRLFRSRARPTYRLSSQNTPDAFSDHRGLGLTHRYPVSLEPERSGSATPDFPGLGHLQRLPANPLSFVLTLIPRPGSQRPRNGSACRRREVHRSGLDRFHGNPGPFTDVDELLQLSASGVADQCAKQSPHRGPLREDRQVGAGTQVGSCLSTPRSRCRRTGQRPSSPASSPARGSLLPDEPSPAPSRSSLMRQ